MDQPDQHAVLVYGAQAQYMKPSVISAKLGDKDKKFIHQVTGTFLHYAWAVDETVLLVLSAITSDQSAPQQKK